jgi:hypothetical protein
MHQSHFVAVVSLIPYDKRSAPRIEYPTKRLLGRQENKSSGQTIILVLCYPTLK